MESRMEVTETVCPVCTLFLRPGITLKQHLTSHPKQKVIDALVKLSLHEELQKSQHSQTQHNPGISQGIPQNQPPTAPMPPYHHQVALGHPPNMGPLPGNHFFMYQQSMSTSSPHQSNVSPMPLNPFTQQYFVPAVYNAQMMPYFYHQQQQLIMSSNGIPPHIRALPFEPPNSGPLSETVVSRPSDGPVDELKDKVAEKEEEAEKSTQVQEPNQQDELSSQNNNERCAEADLDEEVQLVQEDDPLSIDSQDHEEDGRYKDEQEQKTDASYVHNENSSDHDYQSHILHENDTEYETHQIVDHEECIGTPLSHSSNSEWHFHSDLNKACQTQASSHLSPRSSNQNEEAPILTEATPEYFFLDQRSNMSVTLTSDNVRTCFEQAEPIYTSANILGSNEGVEFMSMEDIEGMQVIIGDFSNSPIIPQVDSYETIRQENPPILMTIGGMSVVSPRSSHNDTIIHNLEPKSHEHEDSCIENVNIRSDEKMPPRGELSGQESMGSASDITWNQIQHYQDQGNPMCFEHNSWDSSNEMPLYVEENDKKEISTVDVSAFKDEDSKETIVKPPAEKYKRPKPISLDVNRRKPKKLVIKPKRQKRETHTTFDNVFTNKLKIENAEIDDPDDVGLEPNAEGDNKEDIKSEPKPPVLNVCKDCDKIFKTKRELKAHNNEFHRREKIKLTKCQICDESFDIEHKFNEHLKIHPLECRMCGKLFYRRQGLKLHTARHLGIKPFKCELCDKAFLVKQKLEEHRNCHTGNSPIKCTMCDETFKRHSNLVQHRNRHHFMIKRKIKDYICSCGDVFHSKKKLAWHKEIHDQKPKACTQCSEKFIHMASLTRHMRRAHNAEYLPDNRNPTMANTICPICKGIYLKTSLEAHLKTHTTQKPYNCTICNKEFTTKWNLKLHKWTHASRTQKPFKCELCRGAFIRENDYISHMNSHKSVRPYTCNYCGAQFIRKYNCQRHVKEHENDKTYNCNVCGKSFHRSYYLKDHMRVHSGIRPYSCHICGKTSTTKSNHNKHVQIHHAREPVSTEN